MPHSLAKGKGLLHELRLLEIVTNQGMDCVLERNASVTTGLAPAGATPTLDKLPRRLADFGTIGEALDYAAQGARGLNFHDARGTLTRPYTYAQLREDSLAAARRFATLGIEAQPQSVEAFSAYVKSEVAKWTTLVKEAGIEAE